MKSLFAAILGVMCATAAPAVTIDFSDATCGGGGVCGNNVALDQTYGDITGLDVIYDGDTSATGVQDVLFWATGYETFSQAIWTDQNDQMSVTLAAASGYEVSLAGLSIAPYADRQSNTRVRITDLATSTDVYDQSFTPLSTAGVTDIVGSWTSLAGFAIFFGPDAYNAGIGSITYTAQAISAVPLPAAGWLLLCGLGGIALMRRRTA